MPSFHPFHTFLSARRSDAQRARIARRRQKAAHDVQPDRHLFDRLQRTINTQLNGIVGVLEMIRQHELTSEQRELIGLAQRSANTLLSDTGRLFDGDAFADDTAMHIDDAMRDVRVLVVTPDAALRTRIENELMHRDMRATGVERADAALTALEQAAAAGDPYRIALLDQDIHGIDGETLGSAIGNAPAHRDTLIVLISSEHDRQDADRLALAGFSAWLPKPVPRPMLVDTLAMLCDCIA
ncbi:MAG TPA: response regulator, partial [Oxalicibacterium sp.]